MAYSPTAEDKAALDIAVPLSSGGTYRRFSKLVDDINGGATDAATSATAAGVSATAAAASASAAAASALSVQTHRSVIYGAMVSPAAAGGLAVDCSSGFIRNESPAVVEVKTTLTIATANTTTSGKSMIYSLVADETTGVVTAVAGAIANTGTQTAPALASGKVLLANVTLAFGDTVPSAANCNNAVRTIA